MAKFLLVLLLSFPPAAFSQLSMIELDERTVPEPKSRDSLVDQWDISQPGYQKLPQQAKELLYWTNYCRNNPQQFWDSVISPVLVTFPTLNKAEALSLKADLFSAGKLPLFVLNPDLIRTAQAHASDIACKKAPPGHNSANGTDFGSRMKLAGIRHCASENISLGSQSVLLSVVLLYLDIGLPNLGHRKTLLDQNLQEIGVGSSLYGKDQYFLVQDLACLQ